MVNPYEVGMKTFYKPASKIMKNVNKIHSKKYVNEVYVELEAKKAGVSKSMMIEIKRLQAIIDKDNEQNNLINQIEKIVGRIKNLNHLSIRDLNKLLSHLR